MAGEKGPAVWLRDGLWQCVQKPNPTADPRRIPGVVAYGNVAVRQL